VTYKYNLGLSQEQIFDRVLRNSSTLLKGNNPVMIQILLKLSENLYMNLMDLHTHLFGRYFSPEDFPEISTGVMANHWPEFNKSVIDIDRAWIDQKMGNPPTFWKRCLNRLGCFRLVASMKLDTMLFKISLLTPKMRQQEQWYKELREEDREQNCKEYELIYKRIMEKTKGSSIKWGKEPRGGKPIGPNDVVGEVYLKTETIPIACSGCEEERK
jgi:hypothetical protein